MSKHLDVYHDYFLHTICLKQYKGVKFPAVREKNNK